MKGTKLQIRWPIEINSLSWWNMGWKKGLTLMDMMNSPIDKPIFAASFVTGPWICISFPFIKVILNNLVKQNKKRFLFKKKHKIVVYGNGMVLWFKFNCSCMKQGKLTWLLIGIVLKNAPKEDLTDQQLYEFFDETDDGKYFCISCFKHWRSPALPENLKKGCKGNLSFPNAQLWQQVH